MVKINDNTLYIITKNAGLVDNKYEFSKFCGRSSGWFSCVSARGDKASIAALGIMAARIDWYAREEAPGERRQQLKALHSIVMEEMRNRCAERAGV